MLREALHLPRVQQGFPHQLPALEPLPVPHVSGRGGPGAQGARSVPGARKLPVTAAPASAPAAAQDPAPGARQPHGLVRELGGCPGEAVCASGVGHALLPRPAPVRHHI